MAEEVTPPTVMLSARVPATLKKRLKRKALEQEKSVQDLTIEIIERALNDK